jgi:hypothetical protein
MNVTPPENVSVQIDDSAGELCQVTLTTANGTGSCALTDGQLGPGVYVVDAVTPSGPDFVGSFSSFAGLTVTATSSEGPLDGVHGSFRCRHVQHSCRHGSAWPSGRH